GASSSQPPPQKAESCSSEEEPEYSVAPVLTAEQEAKLWRRIDLRLMPIIILMYLLYFMDRGNAKLDGLLKQLNLTGNKYNIALTMFFIPYSLLEFPSNLAIQVIRPSNYPQLVGVRVCLGTAEAGFFPGVAYYIPEGVHRSWEGLATVLVALVAAVGREAVQGERHHLAQQGLAAFPDWQVWTLSVNLRAFTSISQLLTIPPYVLATITLVTFAHWSDKLKLRSPFIFAGQLIALAGYVINISDAPSGVKYFGTYLCVIGSYSSGPGSISWLANNLGGRYKRAVGMALQMTVGNLGGAVASNIFRSQDEPRYVLGHGLEIVFISIGLVTLPVIVLVYKRINSRRDPRYSSELHQSGSTPGAKDVQPEDQVTRPQARRAYSVSQSFKITQDVNVPLSPARQKWELHLGVSHCVAGNHVESGLLKSRALEVESSEATRGMPSDDYERLRLTSRTDSVTDDHALYVGPSTEAISLVLRYHGKSTLRTFSVTAHV
ncbi:major facilitator superfamily domain-containing protein, partial [Melanogaster broomeanus]